MSPEEENLTAGTFPSPQMPRSDIKQLYVSSNIRIQKTGKPDNTAKLETANTKPVNMATPTTPQDIISRTLGDFGIWQLRTVLIIFLCKIPAAWFMACIIYTGPEIYPQSEFQCDPSALKPNQSIIASEQCYVHERLGNNDITRSQCTKYLYYTEFHGFNQDYDLVCSREIYVAWTQYWHLFGILVGGIVGTKMTLWISPRKAYFWGMVFQIISGIATGFAPDLISHCAFRTLAAVSCACMFTTGQSILVDILGGTYRWGIIMLYDTFWGIGVILLPGIAAFFQNWSYLYLAISFPTLFLMLLLQWTPDSPRWLLKNGRPSDIDRVERTLRDAAVINDRKVLPDLRKELVALREKLRKAPPPAAWSELWHGHDRAKTQMICAHIAQAAYVLDFMGLLLNTRSFGREYRNTSTVAMGFCDIVGCFLAVHLSVKYKKWKWQLAGALNILGGLLTCLGWLFSRNDTMDPLVKLTLWLLLAAIVKATVTCAQSMLYACMNENLPVQKKPTFTFSVVTFARVCFLIAPFINVLEKFDTALSLNTFGLVMLIGGVSTCFLRSPALNKPAAPMTTQAQPLLEKDSSPLRAAVWVFNEETKDSERTSKS